VFVIEDDLDGSPADETVRFDGTDYEIDLSRANAIRLRQTISGYAEHARKITGRQRSQSTAAVDSLASRRPTDSIDDMTKRIREWALEQGYDVARRGRVPDMIRDAYLQAHGTHSTGGNPSLRSGTHA
jgi:hypothetical protein